MDTGKLIASFNHYLKMEGHQITRAMAEQRMLEKLTRNLSEDVAPLLPVGVDFGEAEAIEAFECIWTELIARIDGAAWKLSDTVIAELRQRRYPNLFADRSAGLLREIT